MAAFCSCCGAEIKLKAEVCVVCGAPSHGMAPSASKSAKALSEASEKPGKANYGATHRACFVGC